MLTSTGTKLIFLVVLVFKDDALEGEAFGGRLVLEVISAGLWEAVAVVMLLVYAEEVVDGVGVEPIHPPITTINPIRKRAVNFFIVYPLGNYHTLMLKKFR